MYWLSVAQHVMNKVCHIECHK